MLIIGTSLLLGDLQRGFIRFAGPVSREVADTRGRLWLYIYRGTQ